jgi:hypothetical protein
VALVRKEVLCLGRQQDRFGNWFDVTPRDVDECLSNARKMLTRGVPVPCVWEHQKIDASSPQELLARYARQTFGHLAGVERNDRGNMDALLEVPEEADRRQLKKTRFVSPKLIFNGFRDSQGGKYHGTTIGHVAATPTPVQYWQEPFELSQGERRYLSFTPEGKNVAEENGATDGELGDVIAALKKHGFNISDKVGSLKELTIAIESCKPGSAGDDEMNDADYDLDADDETAPAAGGSGPVMMSDDRARPLVVGERKELCRRVKKLFKSGRVDAPAARKLMKQVQAVELSFTRDADLAPNKLVTKIETLEKLKEHTAWKPTGTGTELSDARTTGVDLPTRLLPKTPTPESAKEATDFLTQFLPGTAKAS